MERLENIKVQIGIVVLTQFVLVFVLAMAKIEGVHIFPLLLLVIINTLVLLWVVYWFSNDRERKDIDISRILGHDAKDALVIGKTGIITYDEQYCATWVSDLLIDRGVSIVGKKLTSWIPKINELFSEDIDNIVVSDDSYIYEIARKDDGQVLFVKDITEFYKLTQDYKENQIVAGLLQLDNYMEIQQYEDESKMAQINLAVRQPLVEWADKSGMMIRRLRSDRFFVVLNEKIYQQLVEDKFSILNTIRKNAEEIDVAITLSMSFAKGTKDFTVLDTMINDLLELAQSRGGDQVAVKMYGESVKYYGGNSEAREKRSKVRVRVMSQAIREAITEAKKVYVVGHRDMDFDCMGSALCMSRLASAYGKESYVVCESGGIEPQLKQAFEEYYDILAERHNFISDEKAAENITDDDLLIVVDHNNPKQTGAPMTLEEANRVIVIDHHRRSEDFIGNPLLVYVETSASSACELVTEFLPYQTSRLNLSIEETTLMYAGILVDTNRFRNRTGSRTFEAVAYLKKHGIDAIAAENMLKDNYDDFVEKTEIMNYSKTYDGNMIISAVDNQQFVNRTLMSKVADSMLEIKGVEASFVIAQISENECGISARSKGNVNVQIIMEKMNGGGHFNAAALQRKDTTVQQLNEELKMKIDEYNEEKKEEDQNESNSAR